MYIDRELAKLFLSVEPEDAGCAAAWWLNKLPSRQRIFAYKELCSLVDRQVLGNGGSVDGLLPKPVSSRILSEVQRAVQEGATDANSAEASAITEHFSASKCYNEPLFVPRSAYPRNHGETYTAPEMRDVLGICPDVEAKLIRILNTIYAGKLKNIPKSGNDTENVVNLKKHNTNPEIRVGVIPSADCLPLCALLHSISDNGKANINFVEHSLLGNPNTNPEANIFNIDVGYVTRSNMKNLFEQNLDRHFSYCEVFSGELTRTIICNIPWPLIKKKQKRRGDVTKGWDVDVISFLSQYKSAPEFLSKSKFNNNEDELNLIDIRIPDHIDSLTMRDVFRFKGVQNQLSGKEMLLVTGLALMLRSDALPDNKLLALSVSTDCLLWAAHNGLVSSHFSKNYDEKARECGVMIENGNLLGRASWQPSISDLDLNLQDAGVLNLNTFCKWLADTKDGESDTLKELTEIMNLHVMKPIREILDELDVYKSDLDIYKSEYYETREKLRKYESALLTPLKMAVPNYWGPLLCGTPESWMSKIRESQGHLKYEPMWYESFRKKFHQEDEKSDSDSATSRAAG